MDVVKEKNQSSEETLIHDKKFRRKEKKKMFKKQKKELSINEIIKKEPELTVNDVHYVNGKEENQVNTHDLKSKGKKNKGKKANFQNSVLSDVIKSEQKFKIEKNVECEKISPSKNIKVSKKNNLAKDLIQARKFQKILNKIYQENSAPSNEKEITEAPVKQELRISHKRKSIESGEPSPSKISKVSEMKNAANIQAIKLKKRKKKMYQKNSEPRNEEVTEEPVKQEQKISPKRKGIESGESSPSKIFKASKMKNVANIHSTKRGKKGNKTYQEYSASGNEKENTEETVKQEKKMSFKRKNIESGETSPSKSIKPCEMKFKERKLMYKKKSEKFDQVKNLKIIWEELRRGDCPKEKKIELSTQVCNLVKGKVKQFAYAHDTVRVLESVIADGTEEHRTLLFEELKDELPGLTKSKYGKYFLFKMLKYGSKKHKEAIMNSFHGNVLKLMKITGAAEVVETAFNECANAFQRFQLVQEFYGANYRLFKETKIHSLAELLAKQPELKPSIINNMKEELLKVLAKSVVKHSIIHHVLLQFFLNADPGSRSDIIESLTELIPEILHTKDGSRVAMHCVWHGNNKDRKAILKHIKPYVKKIAMEEYGHMVLLALFDSVDDVSHIEKVIIKELKPCLLEVSQNVHGRKVLVYLLNHRDSHFFTKDVINILKGGDGNSTSKKDPEIRQQELKIAAAKLEVPKLIVHHIAECYRDNAFCLFVVTVLKLDVEGKKEAFEAIAKLASEPYTSENKNVHVIEYPGSNFMLKQLIYHDQVCYKSGESSDSVTFSEVLVNTVPEGYMKTWFQCNRGAFLIVNLLETEIPAVVNKVKKEMENCKKQLSKLTFKASEILLTKLKENNETVSTEN